MMSSTVFSWTVVGAGPAGILAVGRLLDAGVSPESILWLDPEFAVGDFGRYWFAVPSNTKVFLFKKFLENTRAFHYEACPTEYTFAHLNENDTCLLSEMVKPLQWITNRLREQVAHQKCTIQSLQQYKGHWQLITNTNTISSKNIILATGSNPKSLQYPLETNEIAISIALNPELLKKTITAGAHVAVFGSSHSAVLVIKNLLDAACRVTNFYRSPLRYALYQEDHVIYDNTGLKGHAARFAKENLQGQNIPNLTRRYLGDCSIEEIAETNNTAFDHVIYATGFTARHLPSHDLDCRKYDTQTGIIAPGLFGLGIAYPEAVTDRYGIREFSIGLFKFSNYLTRVLPLWMQYNNT